MYKLFILIKFLKGKRKLNQNKINILFNLLHIKK